jgi:predicted RNase H-like HicB family nuclease
MPKAPSASKFSLAIEYYREADGRWLADIPVLPGVTAYGRTKKRATAAVQALALRLIADRLSTGRRFPARWTYPSLPPKTVSPDWPSTKAKQALAALLRIGWRIKRQSGTSQGYSHEPVRQTSCSPTA